MARSKAKHSNALSLIAATLLPLAASLSMSCAAGAGAGGPSLDAGSSSGADAGVDPRASSSGANKPPAATGGSAGSSSETAGTGGTGGKAPAATGGATGTGGSASTATGGTGSPTPPPSTTPPATGGTTGSTGGTPAPGGAPATGGTTATGGAPATATGGTPATGTGGTPATGTGGTPATGTGGTPAIGTGGTPATGGTPGTGGATGTGGTPVTSGAPIKYVFVVAMENESSNSVYGNSSAPYLNGLISQYAHANAFADPLPDPVPSEPHYVWMEAGTNTFSDTTFLTDDDPSSSNSTRSTAHLSTQMTAASVSWMGYMEGLNSSTGACPVNSSGFYAAKHDPYVFFQDTAGSPPSATNAACAAHHQAYTTAAFGQALAAGSVAQYNFIVPNLCNDMHGDSACPSSNVVAAGDAWLQANLPPIINFVNAHQGVLLIMWDEPEGGTLMPFVAIGPGVKTGYAGNVSYTHSSFTKSVDEIFGLPVLSTVIGANDLGDLFKTGMFP